MKRRERKPGNCRLLILAGIGLYFLNPVVFSQPLINIMPLGNSITYDDNIQDETTPRPVGERIAYRYGLFLLLRDAGYNFDFTGSENSGNNHFQDPEFDDNAGFPGIETWELKDLISTGYNAITKSYVTQGPYLNFYTADIILLHIGTNNLVESASDVKELLDTIRSYDPNVIILVARIINRKTYHSQTTIFNNNVESMVNSRGDDRIIMVKMETGADIDYATEMADNLHPNPAGFDKMAHKWFEAIENLNHSPEIAPIQEQLMSKGDTFPGLLLDDYVYDMEDRDEELSWTFTQQAGSQLEVSIDDKRILHVVPFDNWHGSEVVKLRVEDTGSGILTKRDSVEVLYTINDPPVITSSPSVSEIYVNQAYQYTMTVSDADEEDILSLSPFIIPDWLSFTPGNDTALLTGIPSENDIGSNLIVLLVSDGHYDIFQEFVLNVNFPAGILHDPGPAYRIYPNPTHDEIIIRNQSGGIYTVEIASLEGRLIYIKELEGTSHHIDLSFFQKGTYIVTIRSKDFIVTTKVIRL